MEPYNAIMSIAQIIEDTDISFVIDNEALFNISQKVLKQKSPSFADLNWIMSLSMSGCTASLRFPGILNCDLRKLSVNLTPFPRLHFFTSSYAPLIQKGKEWKLTDWTLSKISDKIWSSQNLLTSIKHSVNAKYLSAAVVFRGRNISSEEIESINRRYIDCKYDEFVEWIPHNVKTSIITLKPLENETEAVMVCIYVCVHLLLHCMHLFALCEYKRLATAQESKTALSEYGNHLINYSKRKRFCTGIKVKECTKWTLLRLKRKLRI